MCVSLSPMLTIDDMGEGACVCVSLSYVDNW